MSNYIHHLDLTQIPMKKGKPPPVNSVTIVQDSDGIPIHIYWHTAIGIYEGKTPHKTKGFDKMIWDYESTGHVRDFV